MLTLKEYNPLGYKLTLQQEKNATNLCNALNQIGQVIGVDFGPLVTSGPRTWHDHNRIYEGINARRKRDKKPPLVVPGKSNHLISYKDPIDGQIIPNPLGGCAVDISDPDGRIWDLVTNEIPLLERLGIYLEAKQGPWVHFQNLPPRSGNRIFNP